MGLPRLVNRGETGDLKLLGDIGDPVLRQFRTFSQFPERDAIALPLQQIPQQRELRVDRKTLFRQPDRPRGVTRHDMHLIRNHDALARHGVGNTCAFENPTELLVRRLKHEKHPPAENATCGLPGDDNRIGRLMTAFGKRQHTRPPEQYSCKPFVRRRHESRQPPHVNRFRSRRKRQSQPVQIPSQIVNQHNIISSTFSGTDKSIPGYPFNGNGKRRLIPLLFRVAYADGWDNRPYQMDSMKEIKKQEVDLPASFIENGRTEGI